MIWCKVAVLRFHCLTSRSRNLSHYSSSQALARGNRNALTCGLKRNRTYVIPVQRHCSIKIGPLSYHKPLTLAPCTTGLDFEQHSTNRRRQPRNCKSVACGVGTHVRTAGHSCTCFRRASSGQLAETGSKRRFRVGVTSCRKKHR